MHKDGGGGEGGTEVSLFIGQERKMFGSYLEDVNDRCRHTGH